MDCILCTLSYGPSVKHQGHELKWKKQGAVTYSTDRGNRVLLEIESSWKAHHEVKRWVPQKMDTGI